MQNLTALLEKFPSLKVLCVGDAMLDTFIYGKVERISPEAPVPVFKKTREVSMLGGVGNVAANIAALGAKVSAVARVGRDADGEKIACLMKSGGISARLAARDGVPTTAKTRIVSANTHILRIDDEEIAPPSPEELAEAKRAVSEEIADADIAVLSDYGKGFVSGELAAFVVEKAAERGIKVVVDPKGDDFSKYRGADIVKPNLKEFEAVSGAKVDPDSEGFAERIAEGAKKIFPKARIGGLVVTLGEHGMFYAKAPDARGAVCARTKRRKVYDVSGAGDTSISAMALCLAAGSTVEEAMEAANIAAGIAVTKLGTATVSMREMEAELSRTARPASEKIATAEELGRIAERLRADGLRVGFTNGCFDLLHRGHLYSLEQARRECDFLVVGVNSDDSVRRLKGAGRPVQDELTRASVLAALSCVDAVCVFGGDTALELVKTLRPDVIAKEGYELDKWPEAQFVISAGGKAVRIKRLENFSTSEIIAKMGREKK